MWKRILTGFRDRILTDMVRLSQGVGKIIMKIFPDQFQLTLNIAHNYGFKRKFGRWHFI